VRKVAIVSKSSRAFKRLENRLGEVVKYAEGGIGGRKPNGYLAYVKEFDDNELRLIAGAAFESRPKCRCFIVVNEKRLDCGLADADYIDGVRAVIQKVDDEVVISHNCTGKEAQVILDLTSEQYGRESIGLNMGQFSAIRKAMLLYVARWSQSAKTSLLAEDAIDLRALTDDITSAES
jgi:regulator of extracellular matrix RemA (YlzA/DUF370 family)